METGQVKYYYDVAEQTQKSPFCEKMSKMIGSCWTCINKQRSRCMLMCVWLCQCASVCLCVYVRLSCKRRQCVQCILANM